MCVRAVGDRSKRCGRGLPCEAVWVKRETKENLNTMKERALSFYALSLFYRFFFRHDELRGLCSHSRSRKRSFSLALSLSLKGRYAPHHDANFDPKRANGESPRSNKLHNNSSWIPMKPFACICEHRGLCEWRGEHQNENVSLFIQTL